MDANIRNFLCLLTKSTLRISNKYILWRNRIEKEVFFEGKEKL